MAPINLAITGVVLDQTAKTLTFTMAATDPDQAIPAPPAGVDPSMWWPDGLTYTVTVGSGSVKQVAQYATYVNPKTMVQYKVARNADGTWAMPGTPV